MTYKVVLGVFLIFEIAQGSLIYYEVGKTKKLESEISQLKSQAEALRSQIGTLEEQKYEYEQEIERLKQKERELVQQKEQLNRRVYDLARNGYALKPLQYSQEVGSSDLRSIRVTAPNGGETLCLGEDYR